MVSIDDASAQSLLAQIDAAAITGDDVDALRTAVANETQATVEVSIVFLAPENIAGQTGVQILNAKTRVVQGLLIDGNGPAPEPCSYRVA